MIPIEQRNYYHNQLCHTEAGRRLQGAREHSYLVRRNCFNTLIITYTDKKSNIKHVTIPSQRNHSFLKNNPELASKESVLDFVLERTHLSHLAYPVLAENVPPPAPQHVQTNDECDICGDRVLESKLTQHKVNFHKILQCGKCKEIIFPFHEKNHKKKCSPESFKDLNCKFCEFETKDKRTLRKHEDSHTHKTHHCQYCEKRFSSDVKLRQHITNKHGDVEKLNCPHCDKTFNTQSGRSRHDKNIHPLNDNIPMFRCTVCEYICKTNIEHKEHMRTHKYNVKKGPFICRNCANIFKTNRILRTHKKKVCVANNKMDQDVEAVHDHNGRKRMVANYILVY